MVSQMMAVAVFLAVHTPVPHHMELLLKHIHTPPFQK